MHKHMTPIRLLGAALITSCVLAHSPVPGFCEEPSLRTPVFTETLNSTHQLIGPLGIPLGEMLTVAATVEAKQTKGYFEDFVTMTAVNGRELAQPKQMPVRLWQWGNVKALTAGQRLTLRGYQDGGMMGVPTQAMKETMYVQTTSHAFNTWFVIVNELQPQP
jgi:hypothetical protein